MQEVHNGNFGLAIAYLLPGFVVVVGVSLFLRSVRAWLSPDAAQAPTVGGFLYVTLASLAAGMTVSAVRWAVIDTVHKWTGLRRPDWNYRVLHERITAYEFLVGNLYRYYQFYSNMLLAVAFAYAAYVVSGGSRVGWLTVDFVAIEWVFWLASRDTLRNYYDRGELLLGRATRRGSTKEQETVDRQ
jgi:hypothetical protein